MAGLYDPDLGRASREHYITGPTALNFPSSRTSGDWHFFSYFDLDAGVYKISLAGIHYPATTPYFGDQGLIEASIQLEAMGVPHAPGDVFIASHQRAAADMLVGWALRGNPNYCTVELDEWFPGEADKAAFIELLDGGKASLERDGIWQAISAWLTSQATRG